MKSIFATLVLCLMLTPVAVASSPGCESRAPQEGVPLPHKSGHYLMIATTDTAKLGEWVDVNGVRGLQTDPCLVGAITAYGADQRLALLA